MILSSPFSRHNKSHQTWTWGQQGAQSPRYSSLPRKPAPEHAAPREPSSYRGGRSATLNRLDQLRNSRSRSKADQRSVISSLGHAPEQTIYAPASVAGPEVSRWRSSNQPAPTDSRHYAASSLRGVSRAGSESVRSVGGESALGQLWGRLGTLRRRAKWSKLARSKVAGPTAGPDPELYANGRREAAPEEIYAEGSQAIDGNAQRRLMEHQLSPELMQEGETRTLIDESSRGQADFLELVELLIGWLNDELAQQRIVVRDLQEDLYDGQVLGKLIEHLHHIQLDLVEVTQNESLQKYKLRAVLETINRLLKLQARWAIIRWSVEGIHSKNVVEIIHLLVTLAIYYRAPLRLPPNCSVQVTVVQKRFGQLTFSSHTAQLTSASLLANYSSVSSRGPRGADQTGAQHKDAFDALFELAPEKIVVVNRSLAKFVNRHLYKINMSCSEDYQISGTNTRTLNPDQFSDGLLLVFLMASLEGYFVPLGSLFTDAPATDPAKRVNRVPSRSALDSNNNHYDSPNYSTINQIGTAIEPTSYINTQPINKLHNLNIALQLIEEAGVVVRDLVRAEDLANGDLKSLMRVLYALFSCYRDR